VWRITFHSDESGYTVARFKVPRTPYLVTIIGNFAQLKQGKPSSFLAFGATILNLDNSSK
jgi:hypothetical protein